MRNRFARFGVWHLVHRFEAFDQVATAQAFVRRINRSVAMHARARLFRRQLSLGVGLVFEHESVAALFAEIFGKGIAGPHHFQSRIFLELRL